MRGVQITQQKGSYLDLRVQRKSRPDMFQQIQYFKSGGYNCGCAGFFWSRRKKQSYVRCHHHSKTTMVPSGVAVVALMSLKTTLMFTRTTRPIHTLWSMVRCSQSKHYRVAAVHCRSCPLYPETCNIHPIRYKRQAKPIVWKLQTALFNGRKKDAVRLIKVLINNIQEVTL